MTTVAVRPSAGQFAYSGLGIEVSRVAILLGLLTFFSGASVKDILPIRAIAGSIHVQDLAKAVLFVLVGAYGLYRLPQISRMVVYWPAILAWLLAGFCVFTTVHAHSPKFALLGTGLLVMMMLFLPAALNMLGRVMTLRVLLHSLTSFLLVTMVVFVFFPSQALFHESEGVRLAGLAHSNGVGQMAGMLVIAALCLHDANELTTRRLAKYLLLALVAFLWAQSRMPMIASLLTVLVYLWRRGTVNARAVSKTVVVLGVLGLASMTAGFVWECVPKRPGLKQESLLTRSGDESELRTFTGRDTIWAFAAQQIAHHPLIGHGYGCSLLVFTEAYERKDLALNYGSAHNLFMEAALNFGWMGIGIIGLSFLALWSLMFVRPENFPDLTILFISLVGITEAVILGPVPGPATMFWILALHWRIPLGERVAVATDVTDSPPALSRNFAPRRVAPC